jgi:hypothetical protein
LTARTDPEKKLRTAAENFERALRLIVRVAIRHGAVPAPEVAGRGLRQLVEALCEECHYTKPELADWLRATAGDIERGTRLHS